MVGYKEERKVRDFTIQGNIDVSAKSFHSRQTL